MVDAVEVEGIGNKRYPIGICYIIIPANVDRDTYVQDCLRRGVVSAQIEDGSFMLDLPIDVSLLQNIDFPLETEQLGSCLVYGTEYKHNKPIIIGRLLKGDESTNLIENEFKLEKYTDSGEVSISGNAKDGNLFINVEGKTENGGKVFVNVSGPENGGKIEVNLKGDLQAEVQNMVFNVLRGMNLTSEEDTNINSSEGVINLGDTESEEGVEPLLLGTKTVDELSKEVQALTDLITSINNIVPVAVPANAIDPTWATWQAVVAAITNRGDLADVKSEKTFTQ